MLGEVDVVEQLRATFEAAMEFGLSDEEVWKTVIEVCDRGTPPASVEDSLDDLSAALATRILEC